MQGATWEAKSCSLPGGSWQISHFSWPGFCRCSWCTLERLPYHQGRTELTPREQSQGQRYHDKTLAGKISTRKSFRILPTKWKLLVDYLLFNY